MRQLSSGDVLLMVATTVDPRMATTGKCLGDDDSTTDMCLYTLRLSRG